MPSWTLPVVLSPFIGSFVAVLIRRLPAEQAVALSRSRCEACGHVLGPLDLIPLVSAALLRMRCRWCGVRFSFAHVAVELACLTIAVCAVSLGSDSLLVWSGCVLAWSLLALAWIDWEHLLLPDALTLPLLLAGLVATLLSDSAAITDHAAAATAGYIAFRIIEVSYRRLRGHDGLGQGDARLLAAGGAWVGLTALPSLVFTAALCGLALAAGLRIAGRLIDRGTAIPFGPPLCLAILVTWMGFDPIQALTEWLP